MGRLRRQETLGAAPRFARRFGWTAVPLSRRLSVVLHLVRPFPVLLPGAAAAPRERRLGARVRARRRLCGRAALPRFTSYPGARIPPGTRLVGNSGSAPTVHRGRIIPYKTASFYFRIQFIPCIV